VEIGGDVSSWRRSGTTAGRGADRGSRSPTGLRARIEDVVVDERARGQGVGTALTVADVDRYQSSGRGRRLALDSRSPVLYFTSRLIN
jgi:GNAT superfamily N-acetyltransferase